MQCSVYLAEQYVNVVCLQQQQQQQQQKQQQQQQQQQQQKYFQTCSNTSQYKIYKPFPLFTHTIIEV